MKRLLFSLIFICYQCAVCFAAEFDVIVVGTSPICLLEALYRYHSGNSVLILEASSKCGGSWKSIDICGIQHADLGCHTLGHDRQMLNFLQDYVGCTIVSMDHPHLPFDASNSPNGFYFPHGCYDMVNNLLHLIAQTDIVLLAEHPLESVYVNPDRVEAIARSKGMNFTTKKILVTPYSEIKIENQSSPPVNKTKYFHLYLLIEDPTPQRFTFHNGIGPGISRMMNLSYFVGLEGTGTQLIVFQTHQQHTMGSPDTYLDHLKKNNLVHNAARILKAEPYIYEQAHYNASFGKNVPNANLIFELLSTGHIQTMASYIPKWKKVLYSTPASSTQ